MADLNLIAAAAAGESGGRSGGQSFSGSDADPGADFDVCPENFRDDPRDYDHSRLDDGDYARIRRPRVRHDAAGERNPVKTFN